MARKRKGFTLKEFFIVLTGLSQHTVESITENNWSFYVSSVPTEFREDVVRLAHYVREEVRFTVCYDRNLKKIPTIQQAKALVSWYYHYMQNPFDTTYEEFKSWQQYK